MRDRDRGGYGKPRGGKFQQRGGGSNGGYYNNPQNADLMKQAEVSTDLTELDTLMKEIQDILIRQDPAAIFIGQVLYTTVADATIKGIEINPIYIEQYFFHRYYRELA